MDFLFLSPPTVYEFFIQEWLNFSVQTLPILNNLFKETLVDNLHITEKNKCLVL